jgi:hypothetical protein
MYLNYISFWIKLPQSSHILVKHHIFGYNLGLPNPFIGNQVKHSLIILISLLLLSSPVIGNSHKGETLYGWGNNLPYVWKSVGSKKLQPKYEGDVENGVPNGLGVLISTNGWKYFGSWKNGEIWNGTEYDKYGNIIYRWVEGKRKCHNLNVKFR